MKSLIFLALALSAFCIYGNETTSENFTMNFEGINNQRENFTLNTQVFKTVYREVERVETCYLQKIVAYRTVCSQQGPNRVCNRVPVYQTIPYQCKKIVRVPAQVLDYRVNSHFLVTLNLNNIENKESVKFCQANFLMYGNSENFTAECEKYVVFANVKKSSQNDNSGNIANNFEIQLHLKETKTIMSPVLQGIKDMAVEGNFLTFKTGNLEKNPNFYLNLFVERRKLLKSDKILIERNLLKEEFKFSKITEELGLVKINLLELLGTFKSNKKHIIRVNIGLLPFENEVVLNQNLGVSTQNEVTIND